MISYSRFLRKLPSLILKKEEVSKTNIYKLKIVYYEEQEKNDKRINKYSTFLKRELSFCKPILVT